MRAILCPGQGSQRPGLLTAWTGTDESREHVRRLGDWAGLDLLEHGTRSDAETLRDTAVAQPLIVAAGLLAWARLAGRAGRPAPADLLVAGHSVGEITAAVIAGVLTEQEGMRLAAGRGRAMAAAASREPSGMVAVVGTTLERLTERLDGEDLHLANHNGAGQFVVGGSRPALERLRADPPAQARVIALRVAGAFHTPYMAQAVPEVQELIAGFSPADPVATLVSNRGGQVLTNGSEVTAALLTQMLAPVRWDLTMQSLFAAGLQEAVELPPAKTLQGLLERAHPQVQCLRLDNPGDVESSQWVRVTA
ncbi:ACP S-malonyltransferase [Kineosporia sp. NBRC 101677]|uniref:ACP S-malonyltransferase n=1 Tax=Kineosporia sp. NBRC 101677 TaxID=3032197 RepID=UPI0024A0755B|nr:ACP S-malonyltransferase [Kineosporia sp. NBRC 101677]GLY18865.1 ACP S-malonyltransferase [Kineosporia sp. NBRC 101677]